jgi:hypothetical protein
VADPVSWTLVGTFADPEPEPAETEPVEVDRYEANRRLQCNCGRFVKASTYRDHGMYTLDRHSATWTCSRCGPTGDGA